MLTFCKLESPGPPVANHGKVSDAIRPLGPVSLPTWRPSARAAEPDLDPRDILSAGPGPTLLANIQATRSGSPIPHQPYEVSVRIPSSMIGGLAGYTVSLISNQTLSQPAVLDAGVLPQGDSAILKLSLDGAVQPSARILLSNGSQCVVPKMLAIEESPPAPPPPRPDLTAVTAMNPGLLDLPPEVLSALESSKRVLVVCHTPPDGDTAGTGLGLRRGLEGLGKQADLFLDGELPAWLRDMSRPGEFRSWEEVSNYGYDTVVVVDVAQSHRVGRASAIVEQAPMAVFFDHHGVAPQRADWKREGPMAAWIGPYDATAMMVAGALERMGLTSWEGVAEPLVSGILTDTELFQRPVRPETGPILKHLVEVRGDGNLESACRRVEPHVADEATGLLQQPMQLKGGLLSEAGAELRAAALSQGSGYQEELLTDLAVMVVPRQAQRLALQAGKLSDPGMSKADLQEIFYPRLNRLAEERPVAVMLWEQPDHVHVSIRTRHPQEAIELARTLGGGGKPGVAAAHPRRPLAEVHEHVRGWAVEAS